MRIVLCQRSVEQSWDFGEDGNCLNEIMTSTMTKMSTPVHLLIIMVFLLTTACTPAENASVVEPPPSPTILRVAVFNVWELSREKLDRVDDTGRGTDEQLKGAAEILQRIRPNVVLINEIDFDEKRGNAQLFIERYLRFSQGGQTPIDYPHVFFEPSNTGVPSGIDLNNSGDSDDPEDAYGFGLYPGQYAMAILSQRPFATGEVRTFRNFLWRDMPNHLMPDGRGGKSAWYSAEAQTIMRLSSKSHWDVPILIDKARLHLLASHPTPGSFDGDEDRNGRRNFDEIRLWADYLSGGESAAYLTDDDGRSGGLDANADFLILGDLNADPVNDSAPYGRTAISQLLDHPRVQDPEPTAPGGAGIDQPYPGFAETRTSNYGRIDYVLPGVGLEVVSSEVFWPAKNSPLGSLVASRERSSDHRLVWADIVISPEATSVKE